jgi:AraC-like DNA-binding protein
VAASAPTLDPFVSSRIDLGPIRLGSFHSDFLPLGRQPEIPTPRDVLFFPRSSTWALPEGRARYLCDPGVVSFWSRGQVCLREAAGHAAVDGDWFGFAPIVAEELVGATDSGALWGGRWLFRHQFVALPIAAFAAQRRLSAALQDGRLECDQGIEAVVALARHCLEVAAGAGGAHAAAARSPRASRRSRDLAEAIRARISAAPERREPITELARHLGVGPVTLCGAFRRATGRTIHAYRLDLRLKLALELLERPGVDLTAIAIELGFDSHSHFSYQFRRRFGVPPSRLRRELERYGARRVKERDSAAERRRVASIA